MSSAPSVASDSKDGERGERSRGDSTLSRTATSSRSMNKLRRTSSVFRKERKKKSEDDLCRELFMMIDEDGGGDIDAEELERFIKIIDPSAPQTLVHEVLEQADEDKSGSIDYSEFRSLVWGGVFGEFPSVLIEKYKGGLVRIQNRGSYEKYLKSLPKPSELTTEEAKSVLNERVIEFLRRTVDPVKLFRDLFDLIDHDKKGSLSNKAVRGLVRIIIPDTSKLLADAVVSAADKDGNGDVDFEEFQVAIEEGSFGMTAEEMMPAVNKAIKRIKDKGLTGKIGEFEEEEDTTGPDTHQTKEDAEAALRQLQEAAVQRKETMRVNAAQRKKKRLRSRLVDFYARHEPDKVREDHIDPLVEATIKKNVDEDDLFRSLYRKYHLDESGEPIEDSVSSDWDASSDEDIDESQLSPEELQKVHARRERKENYQRQKREEAQHKAAAKQISLEAKEERLRAAAARKRFLDEWKTEEERKKFEKEEAERKANEDAERKMKDTSDRFERVANRKLWLAALANSKQQRFEERCIKLEKKKACKYKKLELYDTRVELQETLKRLEKEKNIQVMYSQNVRILEILLADALNKMPARDNSELEKEHKSLDDKIGKLKGKLKERQHELSDSRNMLSANKHHSRVLGDIVAGMTKEVTERRQAIRQIRDDCVSQISTLSRDSKGDLQLLEKALDHALEGQQAELKQKEEERLQDGHLRLAKERGINSKMRQYLQQCDSETVILKERLLKLYPSILMDTTSVMGKVDTWAIKEELEKQKEKSERIRQESQVQPVEDLPAASLAVWSPRKTVVESGFAESTEYAVALDLNDELCFDASFQSADSSPCRSARSPIKRSLPSDWNLPAPSNPGVFKVAVGDSKNWVFVTERGLTVRVSLSCTLPDSAYHSHEGSQSALLSSSSLQARDKDASPTAAPPPSIY